MTYLAKSRTQTTHSFKTSTAHLTNTNKALNSPSCHSMILFVFRTIKEISVPPLGIHSTKTDT